MIKVHQLVPNGNQMVVERASAGALSIGSLIPALSKSNYHYSLCYLISVDYVASIAF